MKQKWIFSGIILLFLWTSESEVIQSCSILCDPMDCSPPGLSVDGISQARILERVAIPFSRGSSQPRDWNWVSCIAGRFFTIWATREGHGQLTKCSRTHDPNLFPQNPQVVTRMVIVVPTSEIKEQESWEISWLAQDHARNTRSRYSNPSLFLKNKLLNFGI